MNRKIELEQKIERIRYDGPSEDRILERKCAVPSERLHNSSWPASPKIEEMAR
jgi:hypothetical protein